MTPDVIKAIREHDNTLWDIGDALLGECGPDSRDNLVAVAAEIEARLPHMERYSVQRLAKLRDTAHAFPKETRRAGFSWQIHAAAGSPEMLEQILGMRS
jgi:hypothetical protein